MKFSITLTAAVVIAGAIHRAGSVVEIPEQMSKGEALDLLRRGKAEVATGEQPNTQEIEGDGTGQAQPDTSQPEPEPEPEAKPAAKNTNRKAKA